MKYLLLFLLLYSQHHGCSTEELFEFDLNCNIRMSDRIIYGQISDDLGTINIQHELINGELYNDPSIRIEQFSAAANFSIEKFYDDIMGQSVLLFLKYDENKADYGPAYFSWETSVLWQDERGFQGVFQPTNPGGYRLLHIYGRLYEIAARVDSWELFNERFELVNSLADDQAKLDYLNSIFRWHPFKVEIIKEIFEISNRVDEKKTKNYIRDFIYAMSGNNLPLKEDLCSCLFLDMNEQVVREILPIYKKSLGRSYDWYFRNHIESVISKIEYPKHRSSSEFKEDLILELIQFLNENPVSNWELKKMEILKLLKQNEDFLNYHLRTRLEELLK